MASEATATAPAPGPAAYLAAHGTTVINLLIFVYGVSGLLSGPELYPR